MKRAKYIISLIFFFCIGYVFAVYTYPTFLKPTPSTTIITPTSNPIKENKPNPEYIVDIPAKYFDPDRVYDETQAPNPGNLFLLGGNLEINNPPIAIDSPTDIEVIDEEYNPKEKLWVDPDVGPKIYNKDIDNDGVFEENVEERGSIDVDNDDKKERIIYGSVAMTLQPHKAIIVKNGRIVYKSDNLMNITIFESKSHNGFYLAETFDIGAFPISGGRRITRFIHENGKFIPVWYREIFDLQTTKP